jgi:phenylpropionate dioxygenase-like ring-hydroxylating dioxygenase large terminal subunit
MTEILTGTNRSAGVTYNELLDEDSHPVRDIMRLDSPMEPGPSKVPVERYFSREFHDMEVEKVWKRVWQMACHEDDIPEVGDYHVYDIATLSFLIVRTGADEFKGYWNACLHRGRQLKESSGKLARDFRCPFHGWAWNLDGSIKEIPCQWDFPTINENEYALPQVQLDRWGGFLFINPDENNTQTLADYLGNLSDQFTLLPYEKRYKAAHVAKVLRCNWKVAQEAFSEAYHVIATHPTILETIGDANTKYDVFGNYSRAMSANFTRSPHLANMPSYDPLPDAMLYKKLRHALSGFVYERDDDGTVHVTDLDGNVSRFTAAAQWIEGPLRHVDPNMCDWIGGEQLPGADDVPAPAPNVPPGANLRAAMAEGPREALRPIMGDDVEGISDAELLDSIYLTVFPNFHPWGSFHRIVYRFRPLADDPNMCIHECMYFAPAPDPDNRPPAAPIHWLGVDDDWVEAPELGLLAKVFNQDVVNMPYVQKGLKTMKQPYVIFADYGETKPRHFHKLLQEWIDKP